MNKQRIVNVKKMDYIIRHFNDESYIETWLMGGCPDESTEADYEYIAEDDESYDEVVDLFISLVEDVLDDCRGIVKD